MVTLYERMAVIHKRNSTIMNPKIRLSSIFIAGMLLWQVSVFGQSIGKEINENISKTESYLSQNPTKAKEDLLTLLQKNPLAADTSKVFIYLKLAKAYGMLNQLDSGIWAADHCIELLTADSRIEKAMALKAKAGLHRMKGEFQQSETAIKASLRLNDSIWKDRDLKANLLCEYANLHIDQNKYYRGTEMFLEALEIANHPKNKDPNAANTRFRIEVNLAEAYSSSGNHDLAIAMFQKVLPKLLARKDYYKYILSGCHMAETLIKTNQFGQADSLTQKLLEMAIYIRNDELKSYCIYFMGLSCSQQKKYREAILLYRQAFALMEKNESSIILVCAIPYLTTLKNTDDRTEAMKVIKSKAVQAALGSANKLARLNFKKVSEHFIWNTLSTAQLHAYHLEIQQLSDSVTGESQKELTLELQTKYQYEIEKKLAKALARENDLLRKSEGLKQNQIYLIGFVAFLLIASIFLLTIRYRQKALLQAKQLQLQQKEVELQKQQTDRMVQERNYRDQLMEQQKLVMMQTLADSEELKEKMNQLVEEHGRERRQELMEQFEKAKEDKLGLDKLLLQFNSIYPGFFSNLNHAYPKLSQSDLQFCILYRMNISTKDIASLLHVEPRSIYAKKYRIMEKMELGKEDDFNKIIFKIS